MGTALYLLSVGLVVSVSTALAAVVHDEVLPKGSPGWCLQKLSSFNLTQFEVLPGVGWDNLENKERGMVMQHTFYTCQMTNDGRYLIPDNVHTTPLKSSKLDIYSDIFSSWMDYKETTCTSINTATRGHALIEDGIEGKFSAEIQHVRKHQAEEISKSYNSIVRTQTRYVKYRGKLQPQAEFHPAFRARLLNIAENIQLNESAIARYESQLLVRDFGTHVLTSVDAGAVSAQIQQVNSQYVDTTSIQSTKIYAAFSASLSFGFIGGIDTRTSAGFKTTDQSFQDFSKNVVHSTIKTYGGTSVLPQNFKLNDWAKTVDENLVTVDREGIPLYYLITPETFPELPNYLIPAIFDHVQKAIYTYYKFNTYRGCTDPGKPNFSFHANVDDGTCDPPSTNFTFGGIYQTCSQGDSLVNNYCSSIEKKNPLTNDFSCPDGYIPILLDTSEEVQTENHQHCHRTWYTVFIGKKCSNNPVQGTLNINSYWCAATGKVAQNSGYMFGGMFTPSVGNPATGGNKCPPGFYGITVSQDLTVCVTQDFNTAFPFSIPLGGFFSCRSGNPLAIDPKTDDSNWPKACPSGHSNHLALVSNDCEIEYCTPTKHFSSKSLISLRVPPFMKYPKYVSPVTDDIFVDTKSNTWSKMLSNKDKIELQNMTMDFETANVVFRNDVEFQKMISINNPTVEVTSQNYSSWTKDENLTVPVSLTNININQMYREASEVEENLSLPISHKTMKLDHASHQLNDEKIGIESSAQSQSDNKQLDSSHESFPANSQPLPNGIVAVLSVISTLLCVCIVLLLVVYKSRRTGRGEETYSLIG